MRIILFFSLILNVILGVVAARKGSYSPSKISEVPAEGEGSAVLGAHNPVSTKSKPRSRAVPWKWVESSDLTQFIANLRASGCPEQTIRDIVTFRICREFRNRLLAFESQASREWDPIRNQSQKFWDESNVRRQELRDQMMDALEDALGQNGNSVANSILGWPGHDDPLASFSTEKRRQIREVERRYRNQKQKVERDAILARGQDPEIQNQLRQLEKQKQTELAAFLSPQDYQEYFFRNSAAADYVRSNLPEALSEAEFRTMVRLADEMEMMKAPLGLFPAMMDSSSADNPAAKEVEEKMAAFNRRLKEVFGEQRVAEQKAAEQTRREEEQKRESERGQQEFRAQLVAIAADAGVSAADANRFWDRVNEVGQTMKPRMDEFEKGLTGTPEEKEKQMKAAARAELEKVAVEMLGAKGKVFVDKMVEQLP